MSGEWAWLKFQLTLPVTERRTVALRDLLHLVVISQHKERLLELAHLLHFCHHILVDSIHDLLQQHKAGKAPSEHFNNNSSLYSARAVFC